MRCHVARHLQRCKNIVVLLSRVISENTLYYDEKKEMRNVAIPLTRMFVLINKSL